MIRVIAILFSLEYLSFILIDELVNQNMTFYSKKYIFIVLLMNILRIMGIIARNE